MNGYADEAIQLLEKQVDVHPDDGEAQLLLCRAYFAEQQVDRAIPHCEAADRVMPNSSSAHDWMGRVYGMKASNAGPISGLKLAHQVREAFEAAFSLDTRNAEAANDLAEFYIDAPPLVGGGLEKAEQLANRIAGDLPQSAHRIRAMVAVKRKDYDTAEREYRAAISVANAPAAWVDLGGFYKARRRTADAVTALQRAIDLDASRDSALVDAASYLMDMHLQPNVAMNALDRYLSGDSKSDAAPVIWVYVLLGRLQQSNGNNAAAREEFNKALQLAANYGPALKALKALQGA